MTSLSDPVPPDHADARPDLEPDVERLHRPILREPGDPEEGRERVPWWLWAVAVLAIFWGGWYLGRTSGPFDTTTHVAYGRGGGRDATVAEEAGAKVETAVANPVERGRQVFAQNCQSCHQQTGRGLAGVFPPLVGSEWVTGPEETVIRILLNGLHGPIQVAGATYDGLMPAWRDPLPDADLVAVATYIRQWAPNAAPAVAPASVAALRAATASRTTPWTAAELRAAERGGAAGAPAAGAATGTPPAGGTPAGSAPPAAAPASARKGAQ